MKARKIETHPSAAVSPKALLGMALERADSAESAVVVMLDDDGEYYIEASAQSPSDLAFCGQLVVDLAVRISRGEAQ